MELIILSCRRDARASSWACEKGFVLACRHRWLLHSTVNISGSYETLIDVVHLPYMHTWFSYWCSVVNGNGFALALRGGFESKLAGSKLHLDQVGISLMFVLDVEAKDASFQKQAVVDAILMFFQMSS